MKKQLLLLVLILLPMVASAYDIEVQNADGKTIYYNYTNDGKELEVTGGGYSENIVIPEEVTYMNRTRKVTSIGYRAFWDCYWLISVTIGNSVTSIGSEAFYGCSGLTSITIPNSVTSIGNQAFEGCSGLTSVTIPNSVTSIGSSAFYDCSGLTSVTIGNSVTSINGSAFEGCTGLTSVTIPNSVTSIGYRAFYDCSGLTSVTIPNSVTSIGESAFFCSGLTSVTIGNSVISIGECAFFSCSSLISITIPNSVTSIGDYAFWNCSGLTTATIGSSVTSIGCYAFEGCTGLTSVTIPNSVTSIGGYAFYDCSGLTSVTIGNSVTSIGYRAFKDCSGLTSITIPNSVTSIGDYAFEGCTGLTSVTIGSGMTNIGKEAFNGADIPTIISLIENPFAIYGKTSSDKTFTLNTFNNATLYIPYGTIDKYKATNGWKDFVFIEEETSALPATYHLTYYIDGTEYKTYEMEEGAEITPEPDPTKEGYTFSGWSEIPEIMPAHDVTVSGTFELIPGYTENIKMTVPNGDRTAIGYSSSVGLDFTGIEDVKAWIVTGFTDDANVLLSRVRIVPPYTGLYLTSNVAGIEVDVPTTDKDIYYANLLKAAVEEETIQPTEMHDNVEFTNFVVGKLTSGEMGFVRVKTARTLGPNKSRLLVPSSYYPVANAAREFNVEFLDDDATTDIMGNEAVRQTANQLYDLQGRLISVSQARKGIYIYKGKKYVIKYMINRNGNKKKEL